MKHTSWFRHDSNAKDDHKVVVMIDRLGMEGYGTFWILIETLREQKNYTYPLSLVPILARRSGGDKDVMMQVITDYDLFEISDDESFYSPSLLRRMSAYDDIVEKKRIAGKRSAEIRSQSMKKNPAPVEQVLNERKGKDKKGIERSVVDNKSLYPLTSFSPQFVEEDWVQWAKNKKGKYKNMTTQGIAIKMLTELASGDEALAREALQTSLANNYQGFTWFFKQHNGQSNGRKDSHTHAQAFDALREAARREAQTGMDH
jgi:hypothetical protein